MIKTNIKMRVTPEQSAKVQEICFENGITEIWDGINKKGVLVTEMSLPPPCHIIPFSKQIFCTFALCSGVTLIFTLVFIIFILPSFYKFMFCFLTI